MSLSEKQTVSTEEHVPPKRRKNNKCSIADYITILNWLPKYSRLNALSDFVAGFSLGLTLIPQSIAYAALAGLTAQFGLYSCLMGGFVYLIFGTIREVSIGPSSLMSLLTLEYTRNMPVDFVVLFSFLAGCVELLMGVLRLGLYLNNHFPIKHWNTLSTDTPLIMETLVIKILAYFNTVAPDRQGFLVDFISMPVTSSFTSATSIIIIISQVPGLLGIKAKGHTVVENIIKICQNFMNIRIPDLILGLSSLAFLLFFRKLKDIDCLFTNDNDETMGNNKMKVVKKILWFLSICRNALVIIITAIIAFSLDRLGSTPFILSGKIESGLPKFTLPPFSSQFGNQTYTFIDMCYHYGTGIIVLPLVAVLVNVAIAKAFASGSNVNATQEMLTLGLCNILGSFVSSMPAAGAFSRSAVFSASGVRTPMAGVYVGTMTLLALSFLTPYFYYIPRATLSAVLISAVVFIIDLKIIPLLWKGCKRDAIAAIVTFLVCVIGGVELGLLVGALFNLIFFLRPSARPKIETIQCKTEHGSKYIILKPDTGLFYPATNYFCNKVTKIVRENDGTNVAFIIDCERIRNIDYTAIKSIDLLLSTINVAKKKLWFLHVNPKLYESIQMFSNAKYFYFIDEEDEISSVFYDGILTSNEEETKEKLLENMTENTTFTCINDNQNHSGILRNCTTESVDVVEGIELKPPQLPEAKEK